MIPEPVSSQTYLEQLRARRQARQGATGTVAAPLSDPQVNPTVDATGELYDQTFDQSLAPDNPDTDQYSDQVDPADENFNNRRFDPSLLPDLPRPEPEQTILEWTAPSRPFKKRNRQYYLTIGAIVGLVSLILFFAGQMIPIAVVISVAFLAYVLASVPPDTTHHKITSYGLRIDQQLHYWEDLGRFWFSQKYGHQLVHFETINFPFRLTLMTEGIDVTELQDLLSQVLLEEKPRPTFFEQASDWLQTHLPLENEAPAAPGIPATPSAPVTPSTQAAPLTPTAPLVQEMPLTQAVPAVPMDQTPIPAAPTYPQTQPQTPPPVAPQV